MSRHAMTHRRSTTVSAVLALTALALLWVPTIAGADEAAVVLGEDGLGEDELDGVELDGVELGEGSLEVNEPVTGGILEFDEVTVTPPGEVPVADTSDEPVDIGQGPIVDDGDESGRPDADPEDLESLDETAPNESSDAICSDVLVRISPDRVQGDQRAVSITSQMIELGVEHWVAVAWQAAADTELTAVSIVSPTGVRTRTGNVTTGTAENVIELVFCGGRSSGADPAEGDVEAVPGSEDRVDAGGDASTGPEATDPVTAEAAEPASPSTPVGGGGGAVAAPSTPAPTTPDDTPSDEPIPSTVATGTVDDENAGDTEVLGLLEERDTSDETDETARPDTENDPGSPADDAAGDRDNAEALGMLADRTSGEDRGASSLPLTLLSLLVAALAAVGAWGLLRRRAAVARTTAQP